MSQIVAIFAFCIICLVDILIIQFAKLFLNRAKNAMICLKEKVKVIPVMKVSLNYFLFLFSLAFLIFVTVVEFCIWFF